MPTCTCHHLFRVDSFSKLVMRVLLSLVLEDDDSASLVDGGANGFTNVFPSSIAFGTLLATVVGWSEADSLEDEFVGVGAVSAVVVDAVGV
ncbi:hypothetical protein Tco_1108688 [Tanacetum coccineum]